MFAISTLIAMFLVAASALMLMVSFRHRKFLCDPSKGPCRGWNVLFSLNVFFLIGYGFFLYEIYQSPEIAFYQLLVASIFLAGGFFVALVVRMSRVTVGDVIKMADQDRHNALHDALTSLPNRSLLYERIELAILQA